MKCGERPYESPLMNTTNESVDQALQRVINVPDADRRAIAEHDGKFCHLPSREYVSREVAIKCHPLNIELH